MVINQWLDQWSLFLFFHFLVWAHHFFTMGQGALTNSSSPLQQWQLLFQQGLRYLTGCLQCGKVKSAFTVPMLYSVGFIPLFTIGGVTGVMLAMSAADYQYHNTMFLVAHFHNTIIPGVVLRNASWFNVLLAKNVWFHA